MTVYHVGDLVLSREDLPQTDQCVKCWNASVVNGRIIHDLIQSHNLELNNMLIYSNMLWVGSITNALRRVALSYRRDYLTDICQLG